MDCPNCGKDVDNLAKHNSQFHEALEIYATERSKSEIQKEIKDLQEYINVASFENPLNMGDSNEKLSALQVEWTNATEGGQGSGPQGSPALLPEQVGRNPKLQYDPFEKEQDPLQTDPSLRQLKDSEVEDDDEEKDKTEEYNAENPNIGAHGDIGESPSFQQAWSEEETDDYDVDEYISTGEPVQKIPEDKRADELDYHEDKPEMTQKEWDKDLAGLKDEYATEEDEEPEEEKPYYDQAEIERELSKHRKDYSDYKEGEEACQVCGGDHSPATHGEDKDEANEDEDDLPWEEEEKDEATEDETETSDDGTDTSTPMEPDVDDTDTDAVATFSMESWDGRVPFNTKVEAFEGIGLHQGDALKLAELNWRELSIEVRGALNEVADDEKEEKRDDIQDAFNNEGDGVGSQPDTQVEDLDEIDYNIIGENPLGIEKYQCEHCNSGFKSNEALMIHFNDLHASATEFLLDVPNNCTYCGQEIPANVSMGEHLAYEHGISLDTKLENGMVTDGPVEPVTKTIDLNEPSVESPVEAPIEEPLITEAEGGWDECQDCNFIGNTTADTNKHKQETGHNTEHFGFQSAVAEEDFMGGPDLDKYKCNGCGKVFDDIVAGVRHVEDEEPYGTTGEILYAGEGLKKNIKSNEVRVKKAETWKPHVYNATEAVSYAEEEFKEDEHPREDSGKFTSGGGGAKTQTKEKPKKSNKLFDKAKARAMKGMKKPDKDDNYGMKQWNQVNNLDGFPTHSSQLRGAGVSVKAPIMKAHLQSVYPDNKWSVKVEYFSMGSAIRAGWKGGGKYPYGASKDIGELYSNHGASNMQVDYSDTDNYVDLYDNRADYFGGDGDHDPRDPQTIANSRQDRLRSWLSSGLREVDYNDLHNWSGSVAEDLVKTGKFTPFQGMTDEHKAYFNKTWQEFQEIEKKEGGVGEIPNVETPEATTPAFHTQQYMADDPKKPTQIPIDPATGEELPVSKFTPKLGDYTKHDVTKSTPDDVEKARKQMQRYKDRGEDQPEPWQAKGESIVTEDDPDFENDPDYQGFVDGTKKEPSQYTQQGIARAMADPDEDALEATETNLNEEMKLIDGVVSSVYHPESFTLELHINNINDKDRIYGQAMDHIDSQGLNTSVDIINIIETGY